jgi:hypothetical protein
MASRWENELNTEAALGASTDWLMTFPTKQFYVDPGIVGTSFDLHLPPFSDLFDGSSCDGVSPNFFDRSGIQDFIQYVLPFPATCLQTNVLTINNSTMDGPSDAIGSNLVSYYLRDPFDEGNLQLEPSSPTLARLRPSNEGIVFNGLPAIGFVVTNFVNANVTQGVLANYSALYPHRTQGSCTPQGQNGC